jgi:hypothetical protein
MLSIRYPLFLVLPLMILPAQDCQGVTLMTYRTLKGLMVNIWIEFDLMPFVPHLAPLTNLHSLLTLWVSEAKVAPALCTGP